MCVCVCVCVKRNGIVFGLRLGRKNVRLVSQQRAQKIGHTCIEVEE